MKNKKVWIEICDEQGWLGDWKKSHFEEVSLLGKTKDSEGDTIYLVKRNNLGLYSIGQIIKRYNVYE